MFIAGSKVSLCLNTKSGEPTALEGISMIEQLLKLMAAHAKTLEASKVMNCTWVLFNETTLDRAVDFLSIFESTSFPYRCKECT
jgi:hypothetical protein